MRIIGHVEGEARARTFSDYLFVQGIDNEVEPEKDGTWAVWIHEEGEMERAKGMLASFRDNATDKKYQTTTKVAQDLRERKKQEQAEYEKRVKGRRQLFRTMSGYGFGPVTFVLIFLSVVVAIVSKLGDNREAIMNLFITKFTMFGGYIEWERGLKEIRHGEVWRLLTPMIIHFGIWHILFNMMWLRDLGSMIEGRQNSWVLIGLVAGIAAGSNLAQYLQGGPDFGGMSGVIYGLLGYIWIRGKLDPASGLYLHSYTVTMMIVWFFLCFTGVLEHVANTAHGVGLVMGMAWGGLSSLRHR